MFFRAVKKKGMMLFETTSPQKTAMKKQKLNYVIWAPPFCSCAGVRALYRLSHELESLGYSAPVLCHKPTDGYHCITSFTKEMQENDIIIYPEIVSGNPLGFHRVVRYVLYFSGKLGGDITYDKNEYIISWSDEYYKDAPILTIPLIEEELFYDAGFGKTQDCIFHHKNYGVNLPLSLDNCIEITMKYPSTRKELAKLLQTTGTLYSFDQHSMLNDEAILCGANVMIVTNDGFKPYTSMNYDYDLFRKQLNHFILNSQNLVSVSPVNKNHLTIRQTVKLISSYIIYSLLHRESDRMRIDKYRIHFGIPVNSKT